MSDRMPARTMPTRPTAQTPPADGQRPDPKVATAGPRPNSPFGRPGGDDDFIINLDGVDLDPASKYPSIGVHLGYCSEIVKATSKAGNPMLVWTFTILEGEDAGKTSKIWTALTPDAMWKFVEVQNAHGYEPPADNKVRLGDLKKHCLRTQVLLDIQEQDYNGGKVPSLAAVAAPEFGAGVKISDPSSPRR